MLPSTRLTWTQSRRMRLEVEDAKESGRMYTCWLPIACCRLPCCRLPFVRGTSNRQKYIVEVFICVLYVCFCLKISQINLLVFFKNTDKLVDLTFMYTFLELKRA